MSRAPVFPVEEKVRVVLSILAGEVSVAEAARRAKVPEQSVGNWKRQFLGADRAGLVTGKGGPTTRGAQLEAEVADLTQALGEAAVELRVWKKSAEGRLGPSRTLEVVRLESGMPTSRFCELIGMPERTWRRHQARAPAGGPVKGPWPRPARTRVREAVRAHALAHPAWGHRKVWAMLRYDGHRVSQATVLRLLRDEGLILEANYQRERRELAANRRAAFAAPTDRTEPGLAAGLLRVRDHLRRDLAPGRVPGSPLFARARRCLPTLRPHVGRGG
ncbi:IS3 family transposase [Actinotalea subterranea]|uniref:IS3 family transposase n=1 Tax=Actinotalea subterranea TaxID=2607497 RepID=UPI001CAA8A06|nr:IS3 family transposase [Actinotalea subterranea]